MINNFVFWVNVVTLEEILQKKLIENSTIVE